MVWYLHLQNGGKFSFLVTSLSGKFVQVSLRPGPGPSASVQFVQFSSFGSFHELFRPWFELRLVRFGSGCSGRPDSVHRGSSCLGGAEEQFQVTSSGNPNPPARSLTLGGGMVRFPVRACPSRMWCDIGMTQIQFKIV